MRLGQLVFLRCNPLQQICPRDWDGELVSRVIITDMIRDLVIIIFYAGRIVYLQRLLSFAKPSVHMS